MADKSMNDKQSQNRRKILEQLEEQKRGLRQQTQTGHGSVGTSMSGQLTDRSSVSSFRQPGFGVAEQLQMTSAQRAALEHAHQHSFGYFITQDSSFGNLILPVLPQHPRKQ